MACGYCSAFGEAPTFPSNAKAIGEWFPRGELGLATAIFDSAAKLGPAIGVPAVGIILIHYGWRWSFAATGLISFLYFLAFCGIYRDPEKDASTDRKLPLLAEVRRYRIYCSIERSLA